MQMGDQKGAFLKNVTPVHDKMTKNLKIKKSLQVRMNGNKKAPFWSSVCMRGSVSVEASIAIPVFLFCFLEILSLLNYISVYSGVLYAIKTTADPICVYGYAYDTMMQDTTEISIGEEILSSVMFSETYLDTQIRKQLSDPIFETTIQNGIKGISLLGSYVNRENDVVSILASYTMKPLISFAGTKMSVLCCYQGKLWTGYVLEPEEEATEKEYVYITETGKVYHLSDTCRYLKLSVKSVKADQIKEIRNEAGGIYTSCSLCCTDEDTKNVYYVTDYGERYHANMNCSGLKRTVYRVEKSEVEGWSACKKCSRQKVENGEND